MKKPQDLIEISISKVLPLRFSNVLNLFLQLMKSLVQPLIYLDTIARKIALSSIMFLVV